MGREAGLPGCWGRTDAAGAGPAGLPSSKGAAWAWPPPADPPASSARSLGAVAAAGGRWRRAVGARED